MEQLEIEQTENKAQTAAAEKCDGEGRQEFSFKKFRDVESLQKAYSFLESEFTRRSQKLRELEGEKLELLKRLETKENSSAYEKAEPSGEQTLEEFLQKFPSARQNFEELVKLAAEGQDEESRNDFVGAYIRLLENRLSVLSENLGDENFLIGQIEKTAIKDRIIREYLSSIKNSGTSVRLLTGGGEIALSPPQKPKNFEEAAMLAESLLQKKLF